MKKLPFQKGWFFAIIEREGSYKEETERKARGQLFRVNELARTNTKSTTMSYVFPITLLSLYWSIFGHLKNLGLIHGHLAKRYLNYAQTNSYRKIASTNTSRLEEHAGFFRLSMKRKIDVYLL